MKKKSILYKEYITQIAIITKTIKVIERLRRCNITEKMT